LLAIQGWNLWFLINAQRQFRVQRIEMDAIHVGELLHEVFGRRKLESPYSESGPLSGASNRSKNNTGVKMGKSMTPKERMRALMMGQKPDRVPVIPFILGYAAKITGISLGDFYSDGDKNFEAQIASMRLHGYEGGPTYTYASWGAWEFGGKTGFPYDVAYGAPYVIEHPVKTVEDVERLEVPSFRNSLPGGYGEADKFAGRCVELGMPVAIKCGGIFTAAASVVAPATLLKWTFREPKAVHTLMEKVSQLFMNSLEYFVSKYGPEKCQGRDSGPVEANDLISRKGFEEFVYPYMEKSHKKMKALGIQIVAMHPCADQNQNIPCYVKLRESLGWSAKYLWLFGPETPLDVQIKAFGDHDIICGNVDPVSLEFKSYNECIELCRENIEAGKNSPSGYVLAPGCEFPPLAAPIKVMALVDAAEKFGRYD
jgi:uroporphyrinogen decarboxylase